MNRYLNLDLTIWKLIWTIPEKYNLENKALKIKIKMPWKVIVCLININGIKINWFDDALFCTKWLWLL